MRSSSERPVPPIGVRRGFDFRAMRHHRPTQIAAIVFFIVGMLVFGIIWHEERASVREARSQAALAAIEQVHAIEVGVERVLGATHALAAMLQRGNGAIEDFEATAKHMLRSYPGAIALQLAPRGIVRQVFPLRGAEETIGHDLLRDPVRGAEMAQAREDRQLVVVGPFRLPQGGMAAAGRRPVFLDDGRGGEVFWGFAIVLFSLPDVLTQARLNDLAGRGYAYDLAHGTSTADNRRVIAASSAVPLVDPVQQTLQLANVSWTLSVAPIDGWSDPYGLLWKAAGGLAFSLLLAWQAAWQVRSMEANKAQQRALEQRIAQRAADLKRFAEVTAHHLQEPARRVVTYSGQLRTLLAGRVEDQEVQMSLDFICEQAMRLRKLLCDVELYLAADQPLGKVEPCDAEKAVLGVLANLSERITEAGAKVSVGQLPPVLIDARRLAHMFEIALDNALQHGKAEQPLAIDISGQLEGQCVRYYISDNGAGVEEAYRERVFRVFERLSSEGEGTGAGLAILRRIAESADGCAWLEESAAGGCCVVLELPANRQGDAPFRGFSWPKR